MLLRIKDVSGAHSSLGVNVTMRKVLFLNEEVYLNFMDIFSHLDHIEVVGGRTLTQVTLTQMIQKCLSAGNGMHIKNTSMFLPLLDTQH